MTGTYLRQTPSLDRKDSGIPGRIPDAWPIVSHDAWDSTIPFKVPMCLSDRSAVF